MTDAIQVSSNLPSGGVAAFSIDLSRAALVRYGVALVILIALTVVSVVLQNTPGQGAKSSFSLLTGAALGIVFARGRFCFFCILRDFIEYKNSAAIYSILTALAVGGIGYAIIFGLFLPNAGTGRLPAEAHIGPVSWVLVAGGAAFGIGMGLSGACISGHLYRLGEGYSRAPIALIGALIGFGVGFLTWQTLYVETISVAPVVWLPASLGYGGSLILHLAVLGLIAFVLLRALPTFQPGDGGMITPARLFRAIFINRWNPLITGGLVGVIGVFSYLRVEPLGVTSQLGTITRTVMNDAGLLGDRLIGLDTFAGCATVVAKFITDNGLLILALVAGSLAVSLIANRFQLSRVTLPNSITALLGGILMGWGAMVSLGCTVGTLLSGISAFAVSGWVFGAAVFAGVWLSIKLKLHNI